MIGSRFELVIFDCDGVLVDSEPIINQAHANLLTACGFTITEQELVERFCGMSDPEMLCVIEREWGRALPASYAERIGRMINAGLRRSMFERNVISFQSSMIAASAPLIPRVS